MEGVRRSVAEECIEDQLLPDSSVRLVLERGGQVRTILMPDEYRTVRVIVSSGVQLSEADLREELSQYGEVEKVRLSTRGGFDDVCGTVTFRLPKHAELAVNRSRGGGTDSENVS